jgi:hypothetical protein
MDAKFFVEELKKITKERLLLKNRYEKCCNDPDLSLETKEIMLNNFEIAYDCLGNNRDKMLKNYMKAGGNYYGKQE